MRAATILFRWRPSACCVTNSQGQLPVEKASLERFEDITKLLTQTHISDGDVTRNNGVIKPPCKLTLPKHEPCTTGQGQNATCLSVFSGKGLAMNRTNSVDDSVFKKPHSPVRHSTPARRNHAHRKKLKHLDSQTDMSSRGASQSKGRSPGVSSSRKRQAHLLKRPSVEVLSDCTSPFDEQTLRRAAGKTALRNDLLSVENSSNMSGQRARSLTLENMNRGASEAAACAPLDFALDPDLQQLQLNCDPMMSMSSCSRDLSRSPDIFLSDASPVGLSLQEIRRQHAAMETGTHHTNTLLLTISGSCCSSSSPLAANIVFSSC